MFHVEHFIFVEHLWKRHKNYLFSPNHSHSKIVVHFHWLPLRKYDIYLYLHPSILTYFERLKICQSVVLDKQDQLLDDTYIHVVHHDLQAMFQQEQENHR